MGWMNNLFGKNNESQPEQNQEQTKSSGSKEKNKIRFGRYSDNNKTINKISRWYDAENAFKEKNYSESLKAFFDYIRDDGMDNVHFQQSDGTCTFELFQGSKLLKANAMAKV